MLAALAAGWAFGLGCSDDDRTPDTNTCFTGRTRVRTPSGDRKLEELRAGDEVIACDPATGVLAARKVLAVLAHPAAETFALDAGDVHVEGVTKTHPIWVASRRAWIEVAELAAGGVLTVLERDRAHAGTRIVESIRATGCLEPVFDLAVEGPGHTFFADDVLVHNKSVAPPCYPDCGSPSHDADAVDVKHAGEESDAGDCFSASRRCAEPATCHPDHRPGRAY